MTEEVLTKARKIYNKYTAAQYILSNLDKDITAVECGGKMIELSEDMAAQVKALLAKNQQAQIAQLWAEFEAL